MKYKIIGQCAYRDGKCVAMSVHGDIDSLEILVARANTLDTLLVSFRTLLERNALMRGVLPDDWLETDASLLAAIDAAEASEGGAR